MNAEKAADGIYDLFVGVVVENDGTDGSVQWVHVFHLQAVGNPTDSTDRFAQNVDFTLGGRNREGINCAVVAGALTRFAGNQVQDNNANWQNDTDRVSPVGSTTKPGVGDLVAWVEEVGGTGTMDFSLTAIYEAA